MKVLFIETGREPVIREINNTLKDMQSLVGGYIEVVTDKPNVAIVVNEEGKLLDTCIPNRFFRNDIIFGDFFVCGVDGEDFCSIPDEEIDYYMAIFERR